MSTRNAAIILILATLMWGFMGVITRGLSSFGMTPMEIVFTRMALSATGLFFLVKLFGKEQLMFRWSDAWLFLLLAGCRVLTDCLLYQSHLLIPLGVCTTLQMTAPYYIVLFSIFLFNEKLNVIRVAALLFGFSGCVLATNALTGGGNMESLGILCAMGSGFAFGAYCVLGKVLPAKGYGSGTVLFWVFLFGSIMVAPFADIGHVINVATSNIEAVAYIAAMVAFTSCIPCYLQLRSMKVLEASKAGAILLCEVVFSTIIGSYLYGEFLNVYQILGIALILGSIMMMDLKWFRNRNKAKESAGAPPVS